MNHHKLNECTFKLSVPVGEMRGEPTRVCSVCGTNELGYTGSYYARDEFWLCPECLKRLKKLLGEEDEE
jgi:hypothetical protein